MNSTDFTASLLPQAAAMLSSVVRASLLGGCGILLVCFIRRVCGRRLAPALRLALWTPAFLLVLMPSLPDLGFGLAPSLTRSPAPAMALSPPVVETATSLTIDEHPFATADPGHVPAMEGGWALTWEEGLALLWAAVIILMLAWWVVVHRRWWRRVLLQSGPVSGSLAELFASCCRDVGLRRAPRLVVTRALANPAVSGVLRPSVLIPEGLETTLPRAELRHVLLHEAAHVRRQDLRWHMASLAVLVLHWFNPLVWLAVRLMRADREAACDAMVLSVIPGDAREAYGTTLLRIQERLAHLMAPHSRLGTLGSADMLRERILDIVHHSRRSSRAGVAALAMSISSAAIVALLGAEPSKDVNRALPSANEHLASSKNPAFRASLLCGASDTSKLEAFIESQIAALKSPELRQKAEERVKVQQPEVSATPVMLDVTRRSGSSVITVTATASDANYARRWLNALLDEITANRHKVEAAENETVRASPEFKEFSEKEKQLVRLVEEQRAAEGSAAPAATLGELKEKLEAERKVYRELKARLNIAVPTFHMGIFQWTFALKRPDTEEKNVQQPPSPRPQSSPPEGSPVSRALIAFEPSPDEVERKFAEEFFGTQIEVLRSSTLRKKVEERLKALHPEITPMTVTVSAARVPDTSQVSIAAWGTNDLYVRYYLDGLLDEMAALRKEQLRNSVHGTVEKVNQQVVEKEKRMKDLAAKLRVASSQNAPHEKVDKLKADIDRAGEDYRVWLGKAEQVKLSLEKVPPFIELKILERPIPIKADGK